MAAALLPGGVQSPGGGDAVGVEVVPVVFTLELPVCELPPLEEPLAHVFMLACSALESEETPKESESESEAFPDEKYAPGDSAPVCPGAEEPLAPDGAASGARADRGGGGGNGGGAHAGPCSS